MPNKILYVCGDSFMTPSASKPGTHFSELVADQLGFNLKVYSRGGMSNAGICVQIESAIENKADFIIANTTSPDRIEISTKDTYQNNKFDVNDIWYKHPQSISSSDETLNQHPRLIIDTLLSLLTNDGKSFLEYQSVVPDMEEKKKAVGVYFKHLYSEDWKKKLDRMCLYSAFHKLETSGIPYLLVLDGCTIRSDLPWLTEKNTTLRFHDFWAVAEERSAVSNFIDPGYHTLEEDQRLAATTVIDHINKYNLI